MQFRFECKVEEIEDDIYVLGDTLRDEIDRMEAKFIMIDKVIA